MPDANPYSKLSHRANDVMQKYFCCYLIPCPKSILDTTERNGTAFGINSIAFVQPAHRRPVSLRITDVNACWSNGIHRILWDVITHPWHNINDSFTKPSLKLRHVFVITSHYFCGYIYPCPTPDSGQAYLMLVNMRRPVPLGFLINKSPLWDGAGLLPIKVSQACPTGLLFLSFCI